MANYHLSVKTVSRSAGRTATAASAYRAGVSITDERTGEVHDYTRKGGVESAVLILPANAPAWAADRAALWNAAEQSETRKNSTVAREFEIALPAELSAEERQRLAHDFARELVERHGLVADVAIHAAGKEGDNRNHHAHILCTTRRLTPEGFTEKTRELDDRKTGAVDYWRGRFAELQNKRLQENGFTERVDHRSLIEQGIIDRAPTRHLGPSASGYERRTGQPSDNRLRHEREANERLSGAKALGELERQGSQLDRSILDLSNDLASAKAERERGIQPPVIAPDLYAEIRAGMQSVQSLFESQKIIEQGKADVAAEFARWKAEEAAKAQTIEAERQRQASELAKQRQEVEAKAKAEIQPKIEPQKGRGYEM